jgi:hypothetical protein
MYQSKSLKESLLRIVSMSCSSRKLLGESLREIGVLILVFVPLDTLLESRGDTKANYPQWMSVIPHLSAQHFLTLLFALSGLGLLILGIVIEVKASKEEKEEERRETK